MLKLKYIVYAVLLMAFVIVAASVFHSTRVHFRNKKEMSRYEGEKIALERDFGRVLVVYYSLSGHTRDIAKRIQEKTNADIYEIRTKEPLPSGMALNVRVIRQIRSENYPEIETDFPNFEKYDLIFVGAPVWWYTVATPALSFLEQVDFKGKKVVPFSTQGSNPGTFERDFLHDARNAVVLTYRGFNNISPKFDAAVDNKIAIWLNGL
ncbi:MAG: hypothetical protein FWD54_04260 [Endomicrobia bacterium]|nr:hypothetical protein [Endomicrobiia bacterium]MCL2799469.1 hypothetical protein [Endomicrobiia bacterium]